MKIRNSISSFFLWALVLGLSFTGNCVAQNLANGSAQEKQFAEILNWKRSINLVVDDLASVLRWVAKNDMLLRDHEKSYLLQIANQVDKDIAKMPVADISVLELPAIVKDVARQTGEPYEVVDKRIRERFDKHYAPKLKDVMENRDEQWQYVQTILDDIRKNLESHKRVIASFYWRVLGNKGLRVLLEEDFFAESLGINDGEIKEFDEAVSTAERVFSQTRAMNNQKAIRAVLGQLSARQLEKLSGRMGVKADRIPELYDLSQTNHLAHILLGRPEKIRMFARPMEYESLQKVSGKYELVKHKPQKELLLELSKWNRTHGFDSKRRELIEMRVRHHVSQFKSPSNKMDEKLKRLFAVGGTDVRLIDSRFFMLDLATFKSLNGDPKYRRHWLDSIPKNHDAWNWRYFDRSEAEFTDEQYRQYVILASEATNRVLNAESVKDVADVYSWWLNELDDFLLPQQSALIYQTNVARNGLVFFLLRDDVANEMDISARQRDNILKAANRARSALLDANRNSRKRILEQILQSLPDDSQAKLTQSFGLTRAKFVTLLASKGLDSSLLRPMKPPKNEILNYLDRQGMFSAKSIGGSIDSRISRDAQRKKTYEVLGISK